jgi:lipoprotein-releasing system permease protein
MAALPDTKPFAGFEWMLALRYLRARKREGLVSIISLLSFLGVMLGVATLIVVMAVFNGFHNELLSKVLGFTGHATVYQPQLDPIPDYNNIEKRLEGVPGVLRATPLVEGQAMVSSVKSATGALVRGLRGADLAAVPGISNDKLRTALRDGGVPDEKPSLEGFDKAGGVAVGERMAWRHQLGLGSTLTLISPNGPETVIGSTPTIRDYQVVAIFKMDMAEYDENVVFLPLSDAQEFFSLNEAVSGLEIVTQDPEDIQALKEPLRDAAGPGFDIQTWRDKNLAFFNALRVQQNVVVLVLSLVILVAALNIVSGLFMLVKEKSANIAILRTVGATSGSVMRVFFMTGAAIGVVGTIAGVILGLVIVANAENIRKFIQWFSGDDPFSAEVYYLSQLPTDIDLTQTITIVLGSLALSFLATLYPAWKAARLDPVEALRQQ